MKIIIGNVYCRLVPDEGDVMGQMAAHPPPHVLPPELYDEFKIRVPGQEFSKGRKPHGPRKTEFISREGRFGVGLLSHVHKWLDDRNLFYTEQDLRNDLVPTVALRPDLLPGIQMRDYQVAAMQACIDKQNGLISIPTGGGKTCDLAALPVVFQTSPEGKPYRHAYLLDRVSLARQTVNRFLEYGLPRQDITLVTGPGYAKGTRDPYTYDEDRVREARVVICMSQMAQDVLKGVWDTFDAVELDESHHARGKGLREHLREATHARMRLGFSGTPLEGMWGHLHDDFQRMRYVGPVIYEIATKKLEEAGHLTQPIIRFVDVARNDLAMHAAKDFAEIYDTGVVFFDQRNDFINKLARGLLGRTLILYKALHHGVEIMRRFGYHPEEWKTVKVNENEREVPIFHPKERWIKGDGRSPAKPVIQMDGQTPYDARDQLIKAFMQRTHAILCASTIFDEGMDLSAGINNLIIAGGEKSYIKQIQRLGRALRPNDAGLTHVFDFTDRSHKILLEHSYLRAAIWDSQGHTIIPLRFEEIT